MAKPTLYWLLLVLALLEVINIPAYLLTRWKQWAAPRQQPAAPPPKPTA